MIPNPKEDTPETVILLHGLAARPWFLFRLRKFLENSGYQVEAPAYETRRWPLERVIDDLRTRIHSHCNRAHRLHFIGHSMGGLMIRALLTIDQPENLGKVVMLGTPNQGSEWANLLGAIPLGHLALRHAGPLLVTERSDAIRATIGTVTYPLGIIAGNRSIDPIFPHLILPRPNDGKVSVAATHVEGETDHIVLPVPHTAMLWNRTVHAQIVAFLRDGHFMRN